MSRNSDDFDPYENNTGTAISICGPDYLVIGSDTRQSSEYTINSRYMSKVYQIGSFYLVTTGFAADGFELFNKLRYKCTLYEMKMGRKISLKSTAQQMSIILYMRRFFPIYSFAFLAGFDEDGPACYRFDPLGFYEKLNCCAYGSGMEMVLPLLDSFILKKNRENEMYAGYVDMDLNQVVKFIKDAFDSVAERDVKTGDYLEIFVVKNTGIEKIMYDLRRD
ncbi:putative proteasome subunit beta type-6 [Dictyocoela muelleri]|nr:putative proteasome subunit beta type-6 [Dictyocoela muelleri]